MSELYQRRDEDGAGLFEHAYETGVFLKFVVDHYDNLPEVTAFVSGDYEDAGGDPGARAALALSPTPSPSPSSGKKTPVKFEKVPAKPSRKTLKTKTTKAATSSDVPPAIASYQPLVVDPETFLQSRSPGELVQMWKEQRWGWEDIMGDSAGAAAAHLSVRRAVAESFGADLRLSTTVRRKQSLEVLRNTPARRQMRRHRAWALRSSSPPAATPQDGEAGQAKSLRDGRRLRDGGGSRRAR